MAGLSFAPRMKLRRTWMAALSRLCGVCSLWALYACTSLALAQDYEREGRWAEQTLATLMVGDAVYLTQANGHRFLALYTRAENKPKGAVIVAHGRGWGPDFELYGALRTMLAEAGYSTLSIQMPVLSGTANLAEYMPMYADAGERLKLATDWLRAKGYAKMAIVSHSLGATMTNHYLADSADPRIDAWVFVGIINGLEKMSRIRIPVLDVFGTRDWLATRYGADERRAQIAKVAGSEQVVVDGAEHFFEHQHAELSRVIAAFLDKALR